MLSCYNKFYKYELGIDEAGRGPLCGPVVACCVLWNKKLENENYIKYVKDSKKLSKKNRKYIYNILLKNLKYGIGVINNEEIDKINILNATKKAIYKSIINFKEKYNIKDKEIDIIIIDGIRWENCFDYKTKSIKNGDNKYFSIASASIIAKEYHDYLIDEELKKNNILEKYDLKNNKGYGTKKHLDAINKYGVTYFHRKSFKRCK